MAFGGLSLNTASVRASQLLAAAAAAPPATSAAEARAAPEAVTAIMVHEDHGHGSASVASVPAAGSGATRQLVIPLPAPAPPAAVPADGGVAGGSRGEVAASAPRRELRERLFAASQRRVGDGRGALGKDAGASAPLLLRALETAKAAGAGAADVDIADAEAYAAVPIEAFGAAMLRGMGASERDLASAGIIDGDATADDDVGAAAGGGSALDAVLRNDVVAAAMRRERLGLGATTNPMTLLKTVERAAARPRRPGDPPPIDVKPSALLQLLAEEKAAREARAAAGGGGAASASTAKKAALIASIRERKFPGVRVGAWVRAAHVKDQPALDGTVAIVTDIDDVPGLECCYIAVPAAGGSPTAALRSLIARKKDCAPLDAAAAGSCTPAEVDALTELQRALATEAAAKAAAAASVATAVAAAATTATEAAQPRAGAGVSSPLHETGSATIRGSGRDVVRRDGDSGLRDSGRRDDGRGDGRAAVDARRYDGGSGRPAAAAPASWLLSHVWVRVADERWQHGDYFRCKGVITDVVRPGVCTVQLDLGDGRRKVLDMVPESALETALPKAGGVVRVVSGIHRGEVATLLSRDSTTQTATIQMESDGAVLRLPYEAIAEAAGGGGR